MTVQFLTFGCRLNTYESEVMRGHASALTDTEWVALQGICAQ